MERITRQIVITVLLAVIQVCLVQGQTAMQEPDNDRVYLAIRVQSPGVLTTIRARFVNNLDTWFSVWRHDTGNRYQMLHDKRIQDQVMTNLPDTKTLSAAINDECAVVQQGDYIGVYVDNGGAYPLDFTRNPSDEPIKATGRTRNRPDEGDFRDFSNTLEGGVFDLSIETRPLGTDESTRMNAFIALAQCTPPVTTTTTGNPNDVTQEDTIPPTSSIPNNLATTASSGNSQPLQSDDNMPLYVGVAVAAALVLIIAVIIGVCVHRRRKATPAEPQSNVPRNVEHAYANGHTASQADQSAPSATMQQASFSTNAAYGMNTEFLRKNSGDYEEMTPTMRPKSPHEYFPIMPTRPPPSKEGYQMGDPVYNELGEPVYNEMGEPLYNDGSSSPTGPASNGASGHVYANQSEMTTQAKKPMGVALPGLSAAPPPSGSPANQNSKPAGGDTAVKTQYLELLSETGNQYVAETAATQPLSRKESSEYEQIVL